MRIVIAGGSMAGLFAAALLRKAGHEVQVYERSRGGLQGRGAGLVAQQEVFDLLRMIGRDDAAHFGVVAQARITLDRDGSVASVMNTPQMQVSWDHLYIAARSAIPDDAYHLGRGAVAAGQDGDGAWLELEGGERIRANLVIGADGIGSTVRRSMLPGVHGPRYAGYVAWRALVPERLLPASASEVLSDRFAFYHMRGGQALGYTVSGPEGELEPGKRRYNAVWYRTTPDLQATLTDREGRAHPFSLPPGGVRPKAARDLLAAARDLLPAPFASVFAADPQPFVQAIFDMTTPSMVAGRLALIGDAAFVARPHTAMGVAKAAGDAMALARAVSLGWTPEASGTFAAERLKLGSAIVDYGRRLGASLS
jgi:2-polyprenyl-6-methoxyphenol hydroxylase-like FAD-dependent oxidoreductase